MEFKPTDFVQVACEMLGPDGEVNTFWRNALYCCRQGDTHNVIYSNGDKEAIHGNNRIRSARTI